MKLLLQPDDGIAPIVTAIKTAKKSIAVTIFRLDRSEIEKALEASVARGVSVQALIAHTNAGGEKTLRKLELRMLDCGVTVTRTAPDLIRYHNKMMIVDAETLYVLGFNFTRLDMDRSRSFGIVTKDRKVVQDALRLFAADASRQPYTSSADALIISPENSRERLTRFIKKARRQLLIYDPKLTDPAILRLLVDRAKAGVDVRILGRLGKKGAALTVEKLPKMRLHVRCIVRDGRRAFVGSQSLRKLELDSRREVGILVREPRIVKQIASMFEADWALTPSARKAAEAEPEADSREVAAAAKA